MHFPAYENLIYFGCRGKSTELYQMLASGCYNDSVWQCWMQLKQGNLQLNDAEKWCYWTVFITWDWPIETKERIQKENDSFRAVRICKESRRTRYINKIIHAHCTHTCILHLRIYDYVSLYLEWLVHKNSTTQKLNKGLNQAHRSGCFSAVISPLQA